jgi:shikimate kinase
MHRQFPHQPSVAFVFLVGFMGAGKTTVGKALAAQLGWRFLDLDDLIAEQAGRSIPEIFLESGEAEFRRLEQERLAGLLAAPVIRPAVIALGGGAFAQSANATAIRSCGYPVVFLDAPMEELWRRCCADNAERPLRQNEEQFQQLYAIRRESYLRADFRVDTTSTTPEEAAKAIAARLSSPGPFGDNQPS